MINGLIRGALQNRLFVLAAACALVVWGVFEARRAPIDVFPDLTAPSVTVVAEAHGMAPDEVEALLTFPIETALNGAAGARRVRSKTSVGLAVINVDFDWGTDIYKARQVVTERLQLVSANLPPGVDPPVIGPIASVMGDILFIGLTSDRHDTMALRSVADWTIARRLQSVPGVAQVISTGGDERQFQVQLDPNRLDAYELTADDVAHALEKANENTSAGFLVENGQESLIQGIGRVQTPDDIGATMIALRDGLPVLAQDLGKVRIGPALKRGEGGVNGQKGIVIGIRKQPGANTLELTHRIETIIERLQASLPEGMEIHPALFKQADFIQVSVDNVATALRDGALLVIVIVLIFLGSVRATLITALAIPLSLLAAVVAMRLQGIEFNTMTLGGMAIAVGALVDDAIIDVENVARRLRLNSLLPVADQASVLTVVFDASREVRRSIVFATVIIVLVFVPLFFLSGVESRLLQPLGFAYAVSLFASLMVALTVTPVLCALLLPGSGAATSESEGLVARTLGRIYAPLLNKALRWWRPLTVVSIGVLAVATYFLIDAGRSFLPTFNEGALTIEVSSPPGTALEASDQLGRLVEEVLLGHPEVVSTARRTGRANGDEHAQPVSSSEVEAKLKKTERGEAAFLAALREDLAEVPGVTANIGQPIQHRIDHMLSGARANIAVKIFGPDLATLRSTAREVKNAMSKVDGIADLNIQRQANVPYVTVRFDRAAIARHGLSVEAVAHEIETAFRGRTVSKILEGQGIYDLVVRYDSTRIDSFEALASARIGTPGGARIPLNALAKVQRSVGPNLIARENVERFIVVMANVVEGGDLRGVTNAVRKRVSGLAPPGYRIEFGGQFESAQAAAERLFWVGGAVLIAIFILLVVALGTARDAIIVLLNLPLALIGGVVGIYVSGGVISVASIIGFITLFGIATRNGIMLVTHWQHLANEEGVTDVEALTRQGAHERLSPILMTALASGLGLLPLALALGEPGSEIQAPMAIVILFGLITSTALNMLLLPAIYRRFGAACVALRS